MTDLDLSRVWVVDPATGREGPGEIVVRDGILEAVTWLEGSDAEGVDPTGVVVAPGFHRPARSSAGAGQRGCRDGVVGVGCRGARRLHDGLRDAEYHARAGRAGSSRCDAWRGRRVRIAGGVACARRRDGRSEQGRRWRRSASWRMPGSSASPMTARPSGPPRSSGTRSPTRALSGCRSSTIPRTRPRPRAPRRTTASSRPCSGCVAGPLLRKRRPLPATWRSLRRCAVMCPGRGSTSPTSRRPEPWS